MLASSHSDSSLFRRASLMAARRNIEMGSSTITTQPTEIRMTSRVSVLVG
jgi:hypothetical protein